MPKILITGGAGFIGSHLVKQILAETDWEVWNVDVLSYAGNLANLHEVANNPRYHFVQADIADSARMAEVWQAGFDYVAHLAAETHVDNSIADATPFLRTNVLGTQVLLDLAKKNPVQRFLFVSTDEVYGDLPLDTPEKFTEHSPLTPSSPYSASKAGADLLCQAYHHTYGVPILTSRCSNNYGTHQYPEKLVPLFVQKILHGEKLPVYGDGKNVREWIAVADHARAIRFLLAHGAVGEVYNVGSGDEKSNLEIVQKMCAFFGKDPDTTIQYVKDRPGHDRRYALDCTKICKLGWKPQENFDLYFTDTLKWYQQQFS